MQIPAGESLLFYSLSTTLSLDLGAVVKGFVFISAIEVRTARLVCCFLFFSFDLDTASSALHAMSELGFLGVALSFVPIFM